MLGIKHYIDFVWLFTGSSASQLDVEELGDILAEFDRRIPVMVYFFLARIYREHGKYVDATMLVSKGIRFKPESRRLLKECARNTESHKSLVNAKRAWKDVLKVSRKKTRLPGLFALSLNLNATWVSMLMLRCF